jgi:DNA-directed RNA polymerase specialized sigma subunit
MEMNMEEYILKNEVLVKFLVNFYYNKVSEFGIEFDDLYQAGVLSLVESYYKYDSTKSSVSTFAYLNIKYGICEFINKNICLTYIPELIINISSNLNSKRREFQSQNGRDMNFSEMLFFLKND